MALDNLAGIEYQPTVFDTTTQEEEPSWQDKVNSLVVTSITGASKLMETSYPSLPDENFRLDSDESMGMIEASGYGLEDLDKFKDSVSSQDLEQKISYHNNIRNATDIVSNMGVTGVVGQLAFSALDPIGWGLGGTAGKLGYKAIELSKATGRTSKAIQGVSAATGGIASYAAMEHSIDGNLTATGAMINGTLGFGLGYALSRPAFRPESIDTLTNNGVQVDGFEKQNYLFSLLHSSADRLKESNNPLAVKTGFMMTRSMSYAGIQNQDTANDFLMNYSGKVTQFKEGFEALRKKHNLNADDEAIVMQQGLEIDHKYNLEKDRIIGEKQEAYKHDNRKALEDEFTTKSAQVQKDIDTVPELNQGKIDSIDEQIKTLDTDIKQKKNLQSKKSERVKTSKTISKNIKTAERELKALIKERKAIKTSGLKGSNTKKTKAKQAQINKLNEELDSVVKFDNDKTINEIKELEGKRNSINDLRTKELAQHKIELKAHKKEVVKLKEQLKSETKLKDKALKDIENYKFDDETMLKFNTEARLKASPIIKNMLNNMDDKYSDVVELVSKFKTEFGQEINDAKLHGYENVDTNYHWSRQYDINKVVENPEGAVQAFKEAIADNYSAIDSEMAIRIHEQADAIVKKLINAKSNYESIGFDLGMLQANSNKLNAVTGSLKSRKVRLNGAKLTNFMNNDLVFNMTGYGRKVGGELAAKKAIGVDNNYTLDKYAADNGITGKDREFLNSAYERVKGTADIDPRSNSAISKIVRGFNQLNYLNFGGWFGVNTMSDMANIGYDFGMHRTIKYATKDIVDAISIGDSRQSKEFARILGLSVESLTNDRAIMMGAESFAQGNHFKGEQTLMTMGAYMSKLNGMNLTIDLMDRTVAMASLDYVLTAGASSKFTKTMNRLGLSPDDINLIRSKGIATFDSHGSIDKINIDKLDADLRSKLERGIRRATRDTVIRGNSLDAPNFLVAISGSHALAKALTQFMRFPVIAYNKLGVKMANNFDAIDATISTMTAMSIVGLGLQLKDIGKTEKKYDLTTKEGAINTIGYALERVPHLSALGLTNTYVDILGRARAKIKDEEYKGRGDVNYGISLQRVNRISDTMNRLSKGELGERDALLAKTFLPYQNMFFTQPASNWVSDEIKENF